MAFDSDRSYLFMENNKFCSHSYIEAISLPYEVATQEAPIKFKKAILENISSEWETQDKFIDAYSTPLSLRNKIPPSFPYFSVDFKVDRCFAKTLSCSNLIGGKNFGRDLAADLLGFDNLQRKMIEKQSTTKEDVLAFKTAWKLYDWTIQINH